MTGRLWARFPQPSYKQDSIFLSSKEISLVFHRIISKNVSYLFSNPKRSHCGLFAAVCNCCKINKVESLYCTSRSSDPYMLTVLHIFITATFRYSKYTHSETQVELFRGLQIHMQTFKNEKICTLVTMVTKPSTIPCYMF